jgi:hypothetical protein
LGDAGVATGAEVLVEDGELLGEFLGHVDSTIPRAHDNFYRSGREQTRNLTTDS